MTQNRRTYGHAGWALVVFLVLAQQVSAGPAPPSGDVQSGSEGGIRTLRRVARMTPLWRTIGTKPFGAFCQYNLECSTSFCRNGHCTFSQPIKS